MKTRIPVQLFAASCAFVVASMLHAQSCPGDLDRDGMVGSADFAHLLDSWGKCRGCDSDINGDGAVDGADLGALLESWGQCQHSDPADERFWQRDDGTITYAGRKYASWSEYLASTDPMSWRCGTQLADGPGSAGRQGEGGLAASPADCDQFSTTLRSDYQPNSTLCVSVVVHVLRNTAGTLGDVSAARVVDQINILNQAFAPARIRFQLASTDPLGNPSLGITFHNNDLWFNDQGDYWNAIAWDTNRYINIYTNVSAGAMCGTAAGPKLGYSDFPWCPESGTAADRVVINWNNFGRNPSAAPWDLGYTCVHEVGHYLGLLHTFEKTQDADGDGRAESFGADGCASGCCFASGDLICDTGRESTAHTAHGCALSASCSDGFDPIANYMDYSDDACMTGFTVEQINRMRCTLMNWRPAIIAPCVLRGDFNGDGSVNAPDLAAFLSSWGDCPVPCPADLDGDGRVDAVDLAMFSDGWYASPLPGKAVPGWATVIEADPDPAVVTNPALRAAIELTGLPWRVRDAFTQIEMVLIPPGSFEMGCTQASIQFPCSSKELPVHTVTLTCPFYMGRYEVTQAQWQAQMGSNPSRFTAANGFPGSDARPVEQVSWGTVQGFLFATDMRLPTEAEWEYACRAATTTAFHGWQAQPLGTNNDALVGTIAWFAGNNGAPGTSTYGTKPVGELAANGFGLHDMAGNVGEWCTDWYANYAAGPATNPSGPAFGTVRVKRGTGWGGLSGFARSAFRDNGSPTGPANEATGFRVARSP